jgi:hypothetical protein
VELEVAGVHLIGVDEVGFDLIGVDGVGADFGDVHVLAAAALAIAVAVVVHVSFHLDPATDAAIRGFDLPGIDDVGIHPSGAELADLQDALGDGPMRRDDDDGTLGRRFGLRGWLGSLRGDDDDGLLGRSRGRPGGARGEGNGDQKTAGTHVG